MKCDQARSLLSGYLDQELKVEEMRHLAAHLEECRTCTADLNRLQSAQVLLAGLSTPHPRPEFWQGAYEKVRQANPRPLPFWQRLTLTQRSTLVLAPALLVASLSLMLLTPDSTPVGPIPVPVKDHLDELVQAHLSARATQPLADQGQVHMLLVDDPGLGELSGE